MATAYIYRTNTSTASSWTFSAWVKRAGLGNNYLLSWGSSIGIGFGSTDYLQYYDSGSGSNPVTTAKYKDVGAWYHIVVKNDAGTLTFYVNGETPTMTGGTTGHALSSSTMSVGSFTSGSNSFDGCMSHVHFIDGTAYSASTFGETDATSGIWKIKTSPSVTYGTNGFFLKGEDSSNLDLDSSGNGLTFTTSGTLTATKDNPSNNFSTGNPLDNYWQGATFTNGNNTIYLPQPGGNHAYCSCSMGVSAGLWYFEAKILSGTEFGVGIVDITQVDASERMGSSETGSTANYNKNGQKRLGSSSSSYGDSYANGDVIGCYIDLTANKLYFAKNGTVQNSGTGIAITAPASTSTGFYKAGCDSTNGTGATWQFNFGNGYFGTTLVSSAVADAGGEGQFEYNPSAGTFDGSSKDFRAICTKNIKEFG